LFGSGSGGLGKSRFIPFCNQDDTPVSVNLSSYLCNEVLSREEKIVMGSLV
jgi:hypothetical protein